MPARRKALIAVAVVVVLAVGGAVLWFLRDDAPPEVSLESATATVATVGASDSTPSTAPGGSSDAVSGTWVVDAETGDFDFESATGSFVGFRIEEELAGIGSSTAVGRTGDVTGSIRIDGTSLVSADVEADLSTVTTNEQRRDDRVQQALETSTYPTATFTITEPVELGEAAAGGGPVEVTATGDLTIHGVTRSVEVALEAQLVEETVVVVGSTEITFADYGVSVPSSPVVLSVEDHATVELQLLLRRE